MDSFFGYIGLQSWWVYLLIILATTHVTMICVTVYLHRHQAHRALDLHPIAAHFFRFWLWVFSGMGTKDWVAVHRKHHAKCEQPEDPHSPVVEGINKVLWEGAELYKIERLNPETLEKYGHGTPDDFLERHVYGHGNSRGLIGLLILELILMGMPGLFVWAVQMIWTPFFAAGVINGIGHFWGYRNFECADASRNIVPWGILIAGEELHNNHHAYATSAKLSAKWWEFDIGWMYIKMMSWVGLAKVRRLPPKITQRDVPEVDLETVKAFISTKWDVLTLYSRSVIKPTFMAAKESTSEKGLFSKHVGRLFQKNEFFHREEDRQFIEKACDESELLKLVWEFRLKLNQIWLKTTASHKELIDALKEWCKEAEATGVKVLQDFSRRVQCTVLTEH